MGSDINERNNIKSLERSCVKLVANYLVKHRHFEALRELERDEKGDLVFFSEPDGGGEEVNFIRELILEGRFADVEKSLSVFDKASDSLFDVAHALYCVRKQHLLELICREVPPSAKVLRRAFCSMRELRVGSIQEMNQLSIHMTNMSTPKAWNLMQGRYECVNELLHECGLVNFAKMPEMCLLLRANGPQVSQLARLVQLDLRMGAIPAQEEEGVYEDFFSKSFGYDDNGDQTFAKDQFLQQDHETEISATLRNGNDLNRRQPIPRSAKSQTLEVNNYASNVCLLPADVHTNAKGIAFDIVLDDVVAQRLASDAPLSMQRAAQVSPLATTYAKRNSYRQEEKPSASQDIKADAVHSKDLKRRQAEAYQGHQQTLSKKNENGFADQFVGRQRAGNKEHHNHNTDVESISGIYTSPKTSVYSSNEPPETAEKIEEPLQKCPGKDDEALSSQIERLSAELEHMRAQLSSDKKRDLSDRDDNDENDRTSVLRNNAEDTCDLFDQRKFQEGDEFLAPEASPQQHSLGALLPTVLTGNASKSMRAPLSDLNSSSKMQDAAERSGKTGVQRGSIKDKVAVTGDKIALLRDQWEDLPEDKSPDIFSLAQDYHPSLCLLEENGQPIRAMAVAHGRIAFGTNGQNVSISQLPDVKTLRGHAERSETLIARQIVHSSVWAQGDVQPINFPHLGYRREIPDLRLHGTLLNAQRAHHGSVYCLDWHGGVIASGSNDKTVKIWMYQDNVSKNVELKPLHTLLGHKSTVRAVRFVNDGKSIASAGGGDNAIRFWDSATGKLLGLLRGHSGAVLSLDASLSHQLLSGAGDGTIRCWDTRTESMSLQDNLFMKSASLSLRPEANQHNIHAVSSCRDAPWLVASGHEDGICRLWDLRMQKLLVQSQVHDDEVRSLSLSRCGKWLLTGSFDGTVALIDTNTSTPGILSRFEAHRDKVLQVGWLPDCLSFVSTSADSTAKLWSCHA